MLIELSPYLCALISSYPPENSSLSAKVIAAEVDSQSMLASDRLTYHTPACGRDTTPLSDEFPTSFVDSPPPSHGRPAV